MARKARADDVGIGILRLGYVAHVRGVGKAQREDARGIWVEFGDSDRAEPARSLQAEVESPDPREQRQDTQLAHPARSLS